VRSRPSSAGLDRSDDSPGERYRHRHKSLHTGYRGRRGTCLDEPREGNTSSYQVNDAAVAKARALIDARHYVLDSKWGDAQPSAEAQNSFLDRHPWSDYAAWHLGLTDGATDETKARYAFVFGDFHRLHRSALIASVYRASEWRHKDVELAAHDLLQHLDATSG